MSTAYRLALLDVDGTLRARDGQRRFDCPDLSAVLTHLTDLGTIQPA